MRTGSAILVIYLLLVAGFGCQRRSAPAARELARVAPGWESELIATVEQSYAGWDVEIGDADNDGQNEVLTGTCPGSRLYVFEKVEGEWKTKVAVRNLALDTPGMTLVVKVVDLNGDGRNEILAGTGQENGGTAFLHVFQLVGTRFTSRILSRPWCNFSSYTHGIACYDVDGDGVKEAFSAYCGGGEIIRYDFDRAITRADARMIHQLSGSGEESLIADVDNDGEVEYLTSNGFRAGKARVEIYEFDSRGELVIPPRVVLDGYDGQRCFYASLTVGDLDNDGLNELVVGWKREQRVNRATILAYRVAKRARVVYTLAREDTAFDLAYFEKMMEIADADNDGRNELVISTRGDNLSEGIESHHLGYVFLYEVVDGRPVRTLIADLDEEKAESSWLAVGDADNDGRNEIVLATGKGVRSEPGLAYVLLLRNVRSSR